VSHHYPNTVAPRRKCRFFGANWLILRKRSSPCCLGPILN